MLVLLPASSTRPLHLKGRINYLSGREVSSLPSAPRRAAAPRGLDADGLAVAGRGGWSRLEVAAAATAVAAASAAVAVGLDFSLLRLTSIYVYLVPGMY